MAQAQFDVVSYNYYAWSSRARGKVNLNLQGAGGETCAVWFVENPDDALPAATMEAPNYYSFYYHLHQLPQLIVMFNDDNGWPNSRISTANEPVGEGELS